MGKLDKDIYQKSLAIKFCLVTGYLPFLEVNVENKKEFSNTSTVITDIDVLGVSIDHVGIHRRILFDCKTLARMSPINRAFWAAGLNQYANCDEAFVILRKKASEAHRFSARDINVNLFSEGQFINFSSSYSILYDENFCYASDITNWELMLKPFINGGIFSKFGDFLNYDIPLEQNPERGLRRLIAALRKGRGELNPEKQDHIAIYYNALLGFAYLMSQIVQDLKNIIDYDADKKSFETILRYYVWGGRDAYAQRQKMSELFSKANNDDFNTEAELSGWDQFVDMVRLLLDSPSDVFRCCFAIRELMFKTLCEPVQHKDIYLRDYIGESKRIRQFITFMSNYLIRSVSLPHDLGLQLTASFNSLNDIKS